MSDEEKFDNIFFTVAQQAQGIEPLLDTLFSFLRRKTDFFSGASNEKINDLVLGIIKKHSQLHEKDIKTKKIAAEKEEIKRKEIAEKKRKEQEAAALLLSKNNKSTLPSNNDDILEMGEDGSFEITKTKPTTTTIKDTATAAVSSSSSQPVKDSNLKSDDTDESNEDKAEDNTPIRK